MRSRVLAAIVLIGVFGAGVATEAQAQAFQCAAVKPSSSLAPAYASVPGQTRCEGFFEKTVSQPFIELLSLTRGAPPSATAASAPSAPLQIRADARAAARLVVQPLPSRPFYRVDAALAPGQVLSWDAAPMLAATRQAVSGLGFLALVTSTSTNPGALPALAPVAFTPQTPQDGRVYAVVRVSVDVVSVAWRSYRVGNDAAASPSSTSAAWTDLPDSNLYAWKHITLTIPMPADGKGLRVDVQAVGAANAQSLPLLRFAIVGPDDGP